MMTHNEPNATNTHSDDAARRPYHAPELLEHGDLAVLTKGFGATGVDGLGYTSLDA
jgi:hypothetical protein